MTKTILDYIDENVDNINSFQQKGVEWINHFKKTLNSKEAQKNKDFMNVVKVIEKSLPKTNQKLNREQVRDLYSDLYTGFIATLLWGHIFPVHLRTIIATPKKDIESQLSKLINGLKEKESLDLVFRKLLKGGDYHIDGIGVSFFTKVLCFTSHIHGYNSLLILDGKMWNAYNAFLKAYGENIKKYKVSNCNYLDYKLYCEYMHSIPSITKPKQLEAFLFTHNNEVKTFLQPQTNTHPKRTKGEQTPQKKTGRRNRNNNILPLKNKRKKDKLVNGYGKLITLNDYPIRLFVAQRGNSFFCQLCYLYEEDPTKRVTFNISIIAHEILQEFDKENWVGGEKSNTWKTYKYVMYNENGAEQKAKDLYNKILSFVEKKNQLKPL